MARKTFAIRLSDEELSKVRLAAQVQGMAVGTYIRFRILGQERDLAGRLARLEQRIGTPSDSR